MTDLSPVVLVVLGVLVLGERIGWSQLLGFAVVLGAAAAITTPPRRGSAPRRGESAAALITGPLTISRMTS